MIKAIAVTIAVLCASVGFAAALAKYANAAELTPVRVHEVEYVLVVVNNRLGLVTMQDFSTRKTCAFAKDHVERETASATLSTTKADCLAR